MHAVSTGGAGGPFFERRVAALALDRLPLPQWLKSPLRGLGRAWRRAEARLRRAQPPAVGRVVGIVVFVASLAVPFGVGYLITHSGASSGGGTEPTSAPTSTPTSTVSSPTTTTPRSPLTRLASACPSLPSGTVAPYLVIAKVESGTAADPRSSVNTRWVGIVFAQAIGATLQSAQPYSITAVLLPSGAKAPATGAPIDRAGTVQLWISWDGTAFHKGIRTWDGAAWHMADETDPASSALTIQVTTTDAKLFWAGLQPREPYGFVNADAGGCSTAALATNLAPVDTVPPS
jgi:hypothetical protein